MLLDHRCFVRVRSFCRASKLCFEIGCHSHHGGYELNSKLTLEEFQTRALVFHVKAIIFLFCLISMQVMYVHKSNLISPRILPEEQSVNRFWVMSLTYARSSYFWPFLDFLLIGRKRRLVAAVSGFMCSTVTYVETSCACSGLKQARLIYSSCLWG